MNNLPTGTYKISNANAQDEVAIASTWGGVNFYCTNIAIQAYNTAAHSGTHAVKLYNAAGSPASEATIAEIHLNGAALAHAEMNLNPNVLLPQSYSIRIVSTNAKTDIYCSVIGFTFPLHD